MIKGEIHRLSGLIQNFLHYGKPIEIRTAADRPQSDCW